MVQRPNYCLGGDGRGAGGRVFTLAGRAFTLPLFTFARGVVFTLTGAFAFGRFTLAGLFVLLFAFRLPFAFEFAFSFVFRGRGRRGLSLLLVFVLRFSAGSSGVTLSGVSPSFVGRLISMATV